MKPPRLMLPSDCPQNKMCCYHKTEHEFIDDPYGCIFHGCEDKFEQLNIIFNNDIQAFSINK